MRALLQRVSEARVLVAAERVGEIGRGLLILLGVGAGDGEEEARRMAAKCAHLRIFEDEDGKMNRSLLEAGGAAPRQPYQPRQNFQRPAGRPGMAPRPAPTADQAMDQPPPPDDEAPPIRDDDIPF